MEIRVFDGIGVVGPDGLIELKGQRQRRLLALLSIRAGSVADVDWLAEYLWDDEGRSRRNAYSPPFVSRVPTNTTVATAPPHPGPHRCGR